MSNFSLSLSDLLLVDGFKEAYALSDHRECKRIMFQNGIDISKPIEEVFCTHRNLHNQVVTCVRFEGMERQDKSWLVDSGCASVEAHIAATSDPFLKDELQSLHKQYEYGMVCEKYNEEEVSGEE